MLLEQAKRTAEELREKLEEQIFEKSRNFDSSTDTSPIRIESLAFDLDSADDVTLESNALKVDDPITPPRTPMTPTKELRMKMREVEIRSEVLQSPILPIRSVTRHRGITIPSFIIMRSDTYDVSYRSFIQESPGREAIFIEDT